MTDRYTSVSHPDAERLHREIGHPIALTYIDDYGQLHLTQYGMRMAQVDRELKRNPRKDKTPTVTIFRKWPNGSIIALFPEIPYDFRLQLCMSYEHVGQHGAAEPVSVVQRTKPASPGEYAGLKRELESIGYNVKVAQKLTQGMVQKRMNELGRIQRSSNPGKSYHDTRAIDLKQANRKHPQRTRYGSGYMEGRIDESKLSSSRSNPQNPVSCRCCGEPVYSSDGHPIHTKCIPTHWGKHAHGINASRCKEFGKKSKKNPTVGERLEMIASSDSSPDWEKDQIWMRNLLRRIGFPKARIAYGVVYLEGYGRPSSVQSVAKQILESSK